jgi:mRNA-degrading endonuclease RelE of RelBE toxin-antitoxin system
MIMSYPDSEKAGTMNPAGVTEYSGSGRKLSGEDKYRLRCGVYRVLYEIHNDQLTVCAVRIRHRKDVYR